MKLPAWAIAAGAVAAAAAAVLGLSLVPIERIGAPPPKPLPPPPPKLVELPTPDLTPEPPPTKPVGQPEPKAADFKISPPFAESRQQSQPQAQQQQLNSQEASLHAGRNNPGSDASRYPVSTPKSAPETLTFDFQLNNADKQFAEGKKEGACVEVSMAVGFANEPGFHGRASKVQRQNLKRYADKCGLFFQP